MATAIALAYGFAALLTGDMLQFGSTGATSVSVRVLSNPYSPAWWNYPALVIVAPNAVLILPFAATISMLVVAAGIGLGMGAGLLVAFRFLRTWRSARREGRPFSTLAGITPPMVAALTLGACCSTSAAAAGGLGALAIATGTSYQQLLANSWYLNVLQIAVLGVALLRQELLLALVVRVAPVKPPALAVEARDAAVAGA